MNELLLTGENVEQKTLDNIPDPNNRNLYLLHSCIRRIYLSGLSNLITFKAPQAILELFDYQKIQMTVREKALMIKKIMEHMDENTANLFRLVIEHIEALPETNVEIYSYSEFADERRAAEHAEMQGHKMAASLSEKINQIIERRKNA